MKGFFYKAGFKCIANIFGTNFPFFFSGFIVENQNGQIYFFLEFLFVVVVKRELEIGLPTDVKHVAHIGWDGTAGAAPSWVCLSLFLYSLHHK